MKAILFVLFIHYALHGNIASDDKFFDGTLTKYFLELWNPGVQSLDTIWLIDLEITNLDEDVFEGLTQVAILAINENPLATLYPNAFNQLTGLQRLSLYGNQLSTLSIGTFDGLDFVYDLNLANNLLNSLNDGIKFRHILN